MISRIRYVVAAAFVAMTLVAAGCSDDSDSASGSANGSEKEEIKVGFSQAALNHPWRVAMNEGNEKYATEHYPDVELKVTDGQNDPSKQVADVESLLAQGVDVLMLSPVEEEALTPIVEQAMADGTPVVTLDRTVNTDVTQHIGGDNLKIGRDAASFLAEELDGEGVIVEIEGTAGASATIERHDGFAEIVKQNPGLKVVAKADGNYQREPAQKFMEDMLQRFGPGELDAVYTHNDEMALGAVQALEDAGRLDEVAVVGVDGQNNAIEAVKDGRLTATFVYPFVAPEGIQQAYKVAKGEDVPPKMVLESTRIDETNVDEWIGKGF